MATSDDDHVPVRDGYVSQQRRHSSQHPRHTAPEEMYWLSHMEREELTEKYVKLKDDFFTIKKFSCKQEDKIKKLQTKLRKLISDRKKDGGTGTSSVARIQELEHQEAIDKQQQSIRELKLKNEQLEKRMKLANVQLSAARKNKPLLFRNVGSRVDSGLKQTRTLQSPHFKQLTRPKSSSPPKLPLSEDYSSDILSPESIQQLDQGLPERVRDILEEARERILALEAERNEFQEQINELHQSSEDNEYEWQQKINALEEEVTSLRQELRDRGVREERDSVAIIRAQRESHTLTARSAALQEQLVLTEEKVVAEKSRANSIQGELEKISAKLSVSENQAKDQHLELQHSNGQLQQMTEKYGILKRENEQLQKENQHLTSLRLASDQRGKTVEVESLKLQIAQLESALQSDLSERGVFLERMTQDKEEMAKLEVEAKELRTKNLELQEDVRKLKQKLDLYDKAGLLNLSEKDLALTSVKQKENKENAALQTELEHIRQSHSELQLLYREKNLELERTSQTIARHATTYKNLQAEIEEVNLQAEQKSQNLSSTIKSLQDKITRRDERSEKLEQQILMLTDKSIKDKLEGLSQDLTQNVKLSKHDNMLEFHIESVTYEASDFSQLKTFVSWTVPFSLEDPLQHTNVAIGKFAHFNYSSLYKFQMKYRNLEYLRDDTVTVSVYILLESGHPAKIGECQLTFCEVLEHPRNTLHGTVPITAACDDAEEIKHLPAQLELHLGQVIGTLSYWFRLHRPCEKIISQHLQNVGVLSSVQQREDQLPQSASNMIKSENPVGIIHPKKKYASVEKPGSDVIANERPSSSKNARIHSASSSKSQSQDSRHLKMGDQNVSSTKRIKSASSSKSQSQDSKHLKTGDQNISGTQRIKSASKSRKSMLSLQKEVEEIEESCQSVQEDFKEPQSPPCSPTSTGTYNIESPQKISPVGSPSSTGTYNVESPMRQELEERPSSNMSDNPEENDSPELPIRPESRAHVSPADGISISKYRRKSSGASSVPPPKPPRSLMKVQEAEVSLTEGSSTSESEGNDTMFEESPSSSLSNEESVQERFNRRERSNINQKQHRGSSDRREGHLTKVVQNKKMQQLRSQSRATFSQSSDVPFSPSRSSIASDSEGVVAVVPSISKAKKSTIYVEVCSLTLHDDAPVIDDPAVEFLFVDYHGFLDLPPEQLETPQSLPKPPPGRSLNFSFGQEFSMDGHSHPLRRQALEDLMRNRGLIKFTVTSEPPEELQDSHDCQDLGYAFVNLHDLLRKGQDMLEEDLAVENAEDGSEMGTLCVTLCILHVLRQLEI